MGSVLNETAIFSFDWDDTTGDVMSIRCVNNSQFTVKASIAGIGSGAAGRTRSGVFAPGDTTISIPSAQRPRYPMAPDENGVPGIGGYVATFGGY